MKNNGGGGNLGYFKRKNKKKEQKSDVFGSDDDTFEDTLDIKEDKEEKPPVKEFFSSFVEKFKKPFEHKKNDEDKENPFSD
ncbi:MAG: hypothetical protein PHV37_04045 [Candidatus Gastranaerophilales bacterium]|nr:hypothetical protein [Candidatus Gastranaerophilales bacterium]